MSADTLTAGTPIGPYRILSELGRGGMAVVYLAEQREPVKRQVALKVLKAGMDSAQILGRFDAERQLLAVLDHPHIAKVFDGGSTERGYPYFVMELVRGVPLTDYCDTHRLSIERRLELLVKVCGAVQHAHQKGIIHRDLKPSNILVAMRDGQPWPMVIDFGIAKAVHSEGGDAQYTRIGQIMGTPQYMSPEQAEMSGLDVDTRTDVYSLGCVLYELLVGTTPHDMRKVPAHAVGNALRETAVTRPSARLDEFRDHRARLAQYRETDVRTLHGALRGDLDWVVLKALAADRTVRYSTPEALADDLRRFVAHQPVTAHPPSMAYQLRRMFRRHRAATLGGALVLMSLVGGLGAAAYGLVQARAASEEARREAQTSRQVTELMASLFEIADPERSGGRITAREVVDEGLDRINETLTDQPAVRAEVLLAIGNVYKNLGVFDPAEAVLQESLELRAGLGETDSAGYADTQRALAGVYLRSNHFKEAADLYDVVLASYERLHGKASVPYAEALGDQASAYGEHPIRDRERVVEMRREALAILAGLGADETLIEESRVLLASALVRVNQPEEAEAMFRSALARLEILQANNPVRLSHHRNSYMRLLYRNGRLREAADEMRRIIALRQEAFEGELHPDIAIAHRNLGLILLALREDDEAMRVLRSGLAQMEAIYGDEPNPDIAAAQGDVAIATLLANRPVEAIPMFQRAIRIRLEAQGPNIESGALEMMLADAWLRTGDAERALQHALASKSTFRESLSETGQPFWVSLSESVEFWARERLGEIEDASAYLQKPYDRYVERGRNTGHTYLTTVQRLMLYHQQHGNATEAAKYAALMAAPD